MNYAWFPVTRQQYLRHVKFHPLYESDREHREDGSYWVKQYMKKVFSEDAMNDYYDFLQVVYGMPNEELRSRLLKETKNKLPDSDDSWDHMVENLTTLQLQGPPVNYDVTKHRAKTKSGGRLRRKSSTIT